MLWLTQSGWRSNCLALAAGALITLTLAPFELWPLAFVSSIVLYLSLSHLNARQAVLRGWWFGLGMFASGTSWVYVSIHDYGAASPVLAAFLTAVFVAGLALFLALFGLALGAFLSTPATFFKQRFCFCCPLWPLKPFAAGC